MNVSTKFQTIHTVSQQLKQHNTNSNNLPLDVLCYIFTFIDALHRCRYIRISNQIKSFIYQTILNTKTFLLTVRWSTGTLLTNQQTNTFNKIYFIIFIFSHIFQKILAYFFSNFSKLLLKHV